MLDIRLCLVIDRQMSELCVANDWIGTHRPSHIQTLIIKRQRGLAMIDIVYFVYVRQSQFNQVVITHSSLKMSPLMCFRIPQNAFREKPNRKIIMKRID